VLSILHTPENRLGTLQVTLQRANYLSRVDRGWEIRNRRQKTDIGKYSFVNRTFYFRNKLPMNDLGTLPSKLSTCRKRVRKVICEVK
jgi:hypothetical protein